MFHLVEVIFHNNEMFVDYSNQIIKKKKKNPMKFTCNLTAITMAFESPPSIVRFRTIRTILNLHNL